MKTFSVFVINSLVFPEYSYMFVFLLQCQIAWGSPCSVSVSIATTGLFLHPLACPLGFLGGVYAGVFRSAGRPIFPQDSMHAFYNACGNQDTVVGDLSPNKLVSEIAVHIFTPSWAIKNLSTETK